MSDRIAIMREGQFEQIGTPEEIYEHPQTRFAAGFIGQTNLIEMDVQAVSEDGLTLAYGGASVPARRAEFPVQPGEKVALSLRTERIGYARTPLEACALPATLKSRHYAGGSMRAILKLETGREVLVLCQSAQRAEGEIGDRVYLSWNPAEAPVVR